MTIGEKIIARAAKVDQVKAGEIHTIEVDRLMSNDGTTHLTVNAYHITRLRNTLQDHGQEQTGIYHGPQCACGESKNSSST